MTDAAYVGPYAGERSLPAQLIATALFIGITAAMVAAFRHAFLPEAADAGGGAFLTAPGGSSEAGPSGRPTEAQVRQLHAALLKKHGVNSRGLPRVAAVDFDPWPDRLHIVVALEEDVSVLSPAATADLPPMRAVLETVHAAGHQWSWVLLTCTAKIDDRDGQLIEATVVRALFPRDKLDSVDWPRLRAAELPKMAEQFWLHPDLEARRASAKIH